MGAPDETMVFMAMPILETVMFVRCADCKGHGLIAGEPPIHDCLPENSPRVVRPERRPRRWMCGKCLGRGFVPTSVTVELVDRLAAEWQAYREKYGPLSAASPNFPP